MEVQAISLLAPLASAVHGVKRPLLSASDTAPVGCAVSAPP